MPNSEIVGDRTVNPSGTAHGVALRVAHLWPIWADLSIAIDDPRILTRNATRVPYNDWRRKHVSKES